MSTGNLGLNAQPDGWVGPNLALGDYRGQRYPNQFFDISQQYMPPTIKELFRWCTFYFYNSPLIGSSLRKVSRYPITDLIIEDELPSTTQIWEQILIKDLKTKEKLAEINLDYHVYGNAFVSLHLPFTRFLICKSCGHREVISQAKWRFDGSNLKFNFECPSCHTNGEALVKDVPHKDRKALKIIRWSPENIHLKYNEYTGRYVYMYAVPVKLRRAIQRGDKDILEDMPLIVLEAVKNRRLIKFSPDNLFHLKNPTLAEQDQGWGKPVILHVLKDMYYLYTLRRAQEAIALEHIVPFDLIYPLPNAQQDPFIHTDLAGWRQQIETVILKHRRDPNFKAVIPIPIGFGRLGGDGKALLLGPEINYLTQTIVAGMGMQSDMIMGGMNWCADPNTYVATSCGLLRLEEFAPQQVGVEPGALSVATKDGVNPVMLVHRTEKKQVHSIKTRAGLSLRGSKIHRVWKLNEDLSMSWTELQNAKVGDYVASPRKTDLWGTEEVPKELCRILGYLVSEGSVTGKGVIFHNSEPELLEDYKKCFEAVFGKTLAIQWRQPQENHYGCRPMGAVETHDAKIIDMFRQWGMLHYAETKCIPAIIRMATKECVFEFLRALFEGDGSLPDRSEKQMAEYASISDQLLTEIQLLLLNAGIVSYKYPRTSSECSRLQVRSEYAKDFVEQIGFISERKNQALRDELERHGYRCEANKIPHLIERLGELPAVANYSWIKQDLKIDLDKEFYSTEEAAALLGRERTSIYIYIKSGKLQAEKEPRTAFKYSGYRISAESLKKFVENYGPSRRVPIAKPYWNANSQNVEKINWDGVKEVAPTLYDNYRALAKADFIWERVSEVVVSDEEIEMCDLTVENTPSYVANGLVSHNTGSSVTLRMLENDFIQNRSQILDFVMWMKDRIRIWLGLPDIKSLKFADFRMADDVQRNQQLIGLNASGKVSDQTLLTELGYDYDSETKKRIEEAYVQNYIADLQSKGMARSQGEAQVIQYNYQQKLQEMAAKAQETAQKLLPSTPDPAPSGAVNATSEFQAGGPGANSQPLIPESPQDAIQGRINSWVTKLMQMPSEQARLSIMEIKSKMPDLGAAIEKTYNQQMSSQGQEMMMGGAPQAGAPVAGAPGATAGMQPNMAPLPDKGVPRRAGAV